MAKSTGLLSPAALGFLLFKDPVRTAPKTHPISAIKTDQFMLYVAQVAVCSQINTKHINTVWAERKVVEC